MTKNTMERLIPDISNGNDPIDLSHIDDKDVFKDAVINLLNVSGTMTRHGTHYNTSKEVQLAVESAHKNLFAMDRGVYMMLHLLDGATDYSRQKAILAMLGNNWTAYWKSILPMDLELKGIQHIVKNLPPNRVLNLFIDMKNRRLNNTRTKQRLILPYILNASKLEFWSVKYRRKMREALTHAWGKRMTSIIKSILSNTGDTQSSKEHNILQNTIFNYVGNNSNVKTKVMECIQFILEVKGIQWTLPLFKTFEEAKLDLTKGEGLPMEVLEGIRSTYHPAFTQAAVLKTAKTAMSNKQKMRVQKSAQKANVQIKFDPTKQNIIELYKYMFEMGPTDEIRSAIKTKAITASQQIPVRFEKIGILIDDSFSMIGDKDRQKLRPMAIALAMRDTLEFISNESITQATSGKPYRRHRCDYWMPSGSTSMAMPLIQLMEEEPDAVFVITDGYENRPAGRFAETVRAIRKVGVNTPIYQLTPVVGAESAAGVRQLSDEVPGLPISDPSNLGLFLFRAMIEVDVEKAMSALINMSLPQLGEAKTEQIEEVIQDG